MTNSFLQKGEAYIIRTVTYIYAGRVVEVNEQEILLEDAAWIADAGRWTQCLQEGLTQNVQEVEPFLDDLVLPRGGILDVTKWRHALPREVK